MLLLHTLYRGDNIDIVNGVTLQLHKMEDRHSLSKGSYKGSPERELPGQYNFEDIIQLFIFRGLYTKNSGVTYSSKKFELLSEMIDSVGIFPVTENLTYTNYYELLFNEKVRFPDDFSIGNIKKGVFDIKCHPTENKRNIIQAFINLYNKLREPFTSSIVFPKSFYFESSEFDMEYYHGLIDTDAVSLKKGKSIQEGFNIHIPSSKERPFSTKIDMYFPEGDPYLEIELQALEPNSREVKSQIYISGSFFNYYRGPNESLISNFFGISTEANESTLTLRFTRDENLDLDSKVLEAIETISNETRLTNFLKLTPD